MDLDPYAKQGEHIITIAGVLALLYKVFVRPMYLWFRGMHQLLEKMEEVVSGFKSLESRVTSLEDAVRTCPVHQEFKNGHNR